MKDITTEEPEGSGDDNRSALLLEEINLSLDNTREVKESILDLISSLRKDVEIRNERDKYKDAEILRMSNQIADFEKGIFSKIKEDLIREIISYRQSFVAFQCAAAESIGTDMTKDIDHLESELSNILFNNGIDEIENIAGTPLDRRLQKVVGKVATPKIESISVVHKVLKQGFTWNERVIRKQDVEVYELCSEAEAEVQPKL